MPERDERDDRQCPRCGCSTIKKGTRQDYAGQVGWEDGLGPPGPLFLTTIYYTCAACGRVWS